MTVVDEIAYKVTIYQSRTCFVPGCESPRRFRQYCQNHYAALRRRNEHPKDEPRFKVTDSHRSILEAVAFSGAACLIWQHSQDAGYPYVGFQGKKLRVHVIVCEHVNGPKPSDSHEVAHECGVSLCCNPSHLMWKTHRDNILDKNKHGTMPRGSRHHQARLTEPDVVEMRRLRGDVSRMELAARYGVGRSTIDNVLDGVTWRDVA